MSSLVQNLGLDWKLLLSQAVNFLVLLVILRLTVYKPLLAIMSKRRAHIAAGIEKEKKASRRLTEIAGLQKEKTKQAEERAIEIITQAEERAKIQEQKILAAAAVKETDMLVRAGEKAEAERAEALRATEAEAVALVKQILIRTVELSPAAVDEALVKKVAREITSGNS